MQINMLSGMTLTDADRLRFYCSYLKSYQGFDREQARRMIMEVRNWTSKRMSRKRVEDLACYDLSENSVYNLPGDQTS